MREVQWQKNLYENYGLPDNYTDSSFLEQLRKNIKPNNVTLIEAISLGASVSTRLNVVVLFVIIFIWLNNEWTTPNVIVISGSVMTVLGYFAYNMKVPDRPVKPTKDLWTVLIFLTFGYVLSPILKTLTETISTDTIYAMTISMFLTHLIFSKYGSSQIFLTDSLSITSSIFGSLMLASRLASPLHAFSLLTVSVQCFVLLPYLLSRINNKIITSAALTVCTIYLLLFISQTFSYVFVIAIIFLDIVCPLWYIRCQKYKDNIYGPWDEAIIAS
ncbi:PREDICTED: phosphatidylinositol N-acetylglucosaminyltransferase subunit C [Vollenhovia emeryi]|uniref:phosphatidylinositol N-acetylglucosaminyltransferase subunit C n=1 Tax=Vollenhovia emeryi TaxID=411798 RepID=UPI0005F4CB25|nr:PREDICTED: phosphatidylinositol N-acetylglucosaminyltransferase subunit C [Vollenhovia emeryi]XP_011876784.1 PREDICTED: phosphatidylinositol N-acetylglucosaminyltransferase subunit C [Vollenhovia emeryi]XP_011876785.1 PREDICTED: phosphatidylinositol N-acetylglucosaminyltransferase subunit C [Vollenhovia emeryi]XP_011876786.1 PREDICTED: phosphatidylinositol N-acetylglucosaminyltransferase subunit C [Vollenhovia emeryi]XP_011876787.1 PREDICTED: phosphatidylinositol N-acetylglucosaminyltransfer